MAHSAPWFRRVSVIPFMECYRLNLKQARVNAFQYALVLPPLPIPVRGMEWPHDDHKYAPPRPVSSKNAQCSKLSFLPSLKADYFGATGPS